MRFSEDPFASIADQGAVEVTRRTAKKPIPPAKSAEGLSSAATGVLHGFDINEQPLISTGTNGLSVVVRARTTIPLFQAQIGSTVVMLFEHGDPNRPIILGVLQDKRLDAERIAPPSVAIRADHDRFVVTAEREIVLRCGESSITLTRAGKVIIIGKYVLSRSSGCNKIKGATVDIN
jgi:hypothetical protein